VIPSRRAQRIWRKVQEQKEHRQEVARKAAGYIRVSTEEQAATGYSLDAQERAIRAFAESQGYELVDVVADPGVSGASRPEKRPGFSRVLSLAQEGAFSVLLLWKFDRLARNLTHAVTAANTLREQYGVVIRSVTEPIDTATPVGETIFAVLAGMAAQEREAIIERTLAGKKEKARRGGFAGGPAPLGYRRDKEGGLEVDPKEAEVVRRIYAMRRQGMSYRAIADALNAGGIPTKRGGRWHPATVAYILDNPKYEGYVEYFFRWGGEQHIYREGAHEALLPKAG
jgi:DNA invertase Pin-like site-specific DNA recombinase